MFPFIIFKEVQIDKFASSVKNKTRENANPYGLIFFERFFKRKAERLEGMLVKCANFPCR